MSEPHAAVADEGAHPPLRGLTRFAAEAVFVGERIELRRHRPARRVAANPLSLPAGPDGVAVLFPYGVVVFFGVEPAEQATFLADIDFLVLPSSFERETEQIVVRVDPNLHEGMGDGAVVLHDLAIERLQVVAEVLAKSVILAVQEAAVASSIRQIEPFASNLRRTGRPATRSRELRRFVADSLLSEHQIVGLVEVTDRPELLWERPDLEGLYLRLEQEFEIRERHLALGHKLDLISRTARTVLDLLYERRSLRVEWYIVILIVAEIGLTLYELFLH